VHIAGKVGHIGRHENRHAHGGLAIVCGRSLVRLVLLVEQPVDERQCADYLVPLSDPWLHPLAARHVRTIALDCARKQVYSCWRKQ
jgi:hypothetical protein